MYWFMVNFRQRGQERCISLKNIGLTSLILGKCFNHTFYPFVAVLLRLYFKKIEPLNVKVVFLVDFLKYKFERRVT